MGNLFNGLEAELEYLTYDLNARWVEDDVLDYLEGTSDSSDEIARKVGEMIYELLDSPALMSVRSHLNPDDKRYSIVNDLDECSKDLLRKSLKM